MENFRLCVRKQVLMQSLSLPEMAEELGHMEASHERNQTDVRIKRAQVCVSVAPHSVCVCVRVCSVT